MNVYIIQSIYYGAIEDTSVWTSEQKARNLFEKMRENLKKRDRLHSDSGENYIWDGHKHEYHFLTEPLQDS